MGKHRIILIRHAKTPGNKENRYIGRGSDEPVSDEGVEELKKVDLSLIPYVDRVFCSPMLRCKTTAEYLFAGRTIETADDMTEMDFGLYEGKNYNDLKDDVYYQRWIDSGGRIAFPNGEDMQGFVNRSMSAFTRIIKKLHDGESAAIVCHGGNIMSVMSSLTGTEYFDCNVGNMEGYILDVAYNKDKYDLISYDRFGAWMAS